MHLGVFTVLFSQKSWEDMLDLVANHGLKAVELGTGGYPGNSHCPLDELLDSRTKQQQFLAAIHSRGFVLVLFPAMAIHFIPKRQSHRKQISSCIKQCS